MTEPAPINTGVCETWTDAEAITACCADLPTDIDLDLAAEVASDLLYRLSGSRYPGICETTVRPCASYRSCWAAAWDGWTTGDCSCQPLSYIRLAGYPVRQIIEVTIDGVPVDPDGYRLDRNRDLVRMADANGKAQSWPRCQRLDYPEGEVGTWTVDYRYGLEPPLAGQLAAAELACEIAKQCPGSGLEGECDLPEGTVRVTRQGLTIDVGTLGLWLIGSVRTGMVSVDSFLSVYGSAPSKKRTSMFVPEADPWPLRVG